MYDFKDLAVTTAQFNVKDFGAIGDGVADDTLAIQKAVSQALTIRGRVFIPNGKYRITATINCIPVWGKDAGLGLGPNGETLSRAGCAICGEHINGTIIWADTDNWKTTTVNGITNVTQYYKTDGTLTPILENKNGAGNVPNTSKTVFLHSEFMHFSDMWITRKSSTISTSGIAFSTPYYTQTAFSTFERLRIELFSYGFWFRFSLYLNFKDIIINNCVIGIRLARVDDRFPTNNPTAIASWNSGATGWFHNVLHFDRCTIKGNAYNDSNSVTQASITEIAFWGSPMNTVFTACSCENIFRGPQSNNNTIAPVGCPGTGIYIEDGVASGDGKNMGIHQFYTEVLERPLYCTDTKSINIEGLYLQGSWNNISSTNPALEFNNCSFVSICGNIIIPGTFKHFIKATNKSKVFYEEYVQGNRLSGDLFADSTSQITQKSFTSSNTGITSTQFNTSINQINSTISNTTSSLNTKVDKTDLGDISTLNTTNKTITSAINEVNTTLSSTKADLSNKADKSSLGDLTRLTTTAKLVSSAINEVQAGILATSKISVNTINYVQNALGTTLQGKLDKSSVGDLNTLLTTSKTLVGAINELTTAINVLNQKLGITTSSVKNTSD